MRVVYVLNRGPHTVQVLLLLTVLAVAVFGNVVPAPVGAVTPNPPPGGITWAQSEHISTNDVAFGVAVDGSGVYVAGYDRNAPGPLYEWRIEKRSLTTGAIIWGVSEHISSSNDEAMGVAVDASGVYVVGYDNKTANRKYEWRIEKRSLTTGAIIWGVSEDISSGDDEAMGVAVDGSGLYVVGYDYTPGNNEWRVEKRSLTTGAIMWAKSENIGSSSDSALGVAVEASGVYVVGYDYTPGNYQWWLEKRSLTTGAIIWTQSENISSGNDAARTVAVDASGVYVAGYDSTPGNYQWRVEKRSLTTGAIMWSQSENISGSSDQAFGVAVDAWGVYAAGYDYTPGNEECRVEKRSLATGALIWGVSEDISSADDIARGVAVDGSGLYVVGYDYTPGNNEWRVEKRSKPQGDLLSATGTGTVTFTVNNGSFLNLAAKTASSVSPLPPAGLTFPYGLFNHTIGNLTSGASVNVTATLPAPLPSGPVLMYWTFHNGVWRQFSATHFTVAANRTLFLLNLTDGSVPDDKDETLNGLILHVGGVAYAYNVTLVAGWNLISLPVVPVDPTATNLMRSLAASGKLVSVYGYTGTPRTWKYYLPGKASTLTTLNDGYGYWVYMRSADTLYVNGTVIPPASNPPAYALVSGWNLVGFKSQPNATEPKQVGQFLLSINGTYDSGNLWVYDNSNGVWIHATGSTTLYPGDAMWVRMTAAATLYPE